jgi:cardiolipin synthase
MPLHGRGTRGSRRPALCRRRGRATITGVIWLANALTLVRLPLAAVFWLVVREPVWAVAVIAASAISDLLDGRVARYARRRAAASASASSASSASSVGDWLDPLCDKIFAVAALIAAAVRLDTPLWLLALVSARDLIMTPLIAVYRLSPWRRRYPITLRASWPGKLVTAAQFVTLLALVVRLDRRAILALALVTAALGLVATALYVADAIRIVRGARRRSTGG